MDQIRDWWQEDQFDGSRMFFLVSKLKNLKQKIINWNKIHFKNIFQEKLDISVNHERNESRIISIRKRIPPKA